MARITVTDCLEHVENRFQLVLVASKRARQIAFGATPMLPEENDKPTVLSLREIAAGCLRSPTLIPMPNQALEKAKAMFDSEPSTNA